MRAVTGEWKARYQRFWFDLEIPHAQLTLFRWVFFALVGVEAFFQVTSAPRFGTGDFNVPHFPLLLGLVPAPTRAVMLIAFLLIAYAAFRFATDAGEKPVCAAVATGLAATYFVSQLDSYQHHYLLILLVFLCCFVDFKGAARGPATRLLLVQVSFLYGWAAIAKLDAQWLDGAALLELLKNSSLESTVTTLGPKKFAFMTLGVEVFLCVALQIRRLWPYAIAVAVPFHIGVELAGLEIGFFSYFMIAFYLLLLPRRRRPSLPRLPVVPRPVRAAVALAATGLLLLLPFDEAWIFALLIGGAGLAIGLRYDRYAGHLAAIVALLLLTRFTAVPTDYYRFWGGSSRRLGNLETSAAAYQRLTQIRPDYAPAWGSLASAYKKLGRDAEARAAAQQALTLDPQNEPARKVLRDWQAPAD